MSSYDRAFLVPYLRDICTLHLAKKKVEETIQAARQEIEDIQQNALSNVEPPRLEKYIGPQDMSGSGFELGCAGMILMISGLCVMFSGSIGALAAACVIAFIGVGVTIYSLGERTRNNAKIQARNDEKEMEHALQEIAALVVTEPETEAIEASIRMYYREIAKIDELLLELYAVNVIPRWYRDMYPAVYLDDWFSNGRSDDLDMALNTFVLEQIKDKLDVIIQNQSEELLNQRIMIANQFTAMDQQERHHRELMDKLDRMECNDEERNTYMKMMSSNIAANAYFSAANYLKK